MMYSDESIHLIGEKWVGDDLGVGLVPLRMEGAIGGVCVMHQGGPTVYWTSLLAEARTPPVMRKRWRTPPLARKRSLLLLAERGSSLAVDIFNGTLLPGDKRVFSSISREDLLGLLAGYHARASAALGEVLSRPQRKILEEKVERLEGELSKAKASKKTAHELTRAAEERAQVAEDKMEQL
ncbi:hypothetical protein Salat_0661900 [Sesamum alatum]|uniref:Uncharacterized protein n=1 Tax=Sesamum alatum TaxID=300844 RepID=A0AAE2CUV9_9LAMI|nr:hypothetical protein Salat_0661900 [Sesamum alatum]